MRPRVFPAEDGPLATRCDHTMFATESRAVTECRRASRHERRVRGHGRIVTIQFSRTYRLASPPPVHLPHRSARTGAAERITR